MRLICVSDDPEAIKEFESICREIQYVQKLVSCRTESKAMEYIENNLLDIAFIRMEEHRQNGILLAQRMREVNPELRVVIISDDPSYALQAFEICADGYLLRPYEKGDVEKKLHNIRKKFHMDQKKRIYFQTIPHFELFVEDKLVPITQKKVKELLAILVDYAGCSVTSEQIIDRMWEQRLFDENSKALLRMTAKRLRKLLIQEQIDEILIEGHGVRALDISKVECDYYRILKGDSTSIDKYHGEYMSEYSWAEETNGKLTQITAFQNEKKQL